MNDLLSLWRSPLDTVAVTAASDRAAAQPRCDSTIDQLPGNVTPGLQDSVPLWHYPSNQTIQATLQQLQKLIGGGGGIPTIIFPTDFSAVSIYNYGNFVSTPGAAPPTNTAALAEMFAAIASSPGITGGMAWIPNFEFSVNATQAGLFVPSGTIMQGLGNGGDNTSVFTINSVDNLGDTLFITQGPHTSGGTYFRNLSFQWINPRSVNDTAINMGAWGIKVQDCTFTDCPTAVAFGGDASAQGGLGCTLERSVIRYGVVTSNTVPNNAVMIIMSGEQGQVLGPSEFLQQPVSKGGPSGVTGIGWGGGRTGSEHQIISGVHITGFQYGIDFSNRRSRPALVGGLDKFTLRDTQIDCLSQSISLVSDTTTSNIFAGLIEGCTLNKARDSQNDSNAIMLIDTLNATGGGNSNIQSITFVANSIFSNVASGGSLLGIAADHQYGVEIRGGGQLRFIGGQIGLLGNNATNTGGVWSDGSAAVCISDGPRGGPNGGGGPAGVLFSGVTLGPGFGPAGIIGGGPTGAGQSQYGVLVSAALTNGTVTFYNCIMNGYTGTGQAPVFVSGSIATGTFFVTGCHGYNDMNTPIVTSLGANAPLGPGCGAWEVQQQLPAGANPQNYYGPSQITFLSAASASTFTLNGITTNMQPNTFQVVYLSSPYDLIKFNVAPQTFSWLGK